VLKDKERIERLTESLSANGYDALICRLPENVLFLSGWWPLTGTSWVIFTSDGRCHLIIPACEAQEARADGIVSLSTFEWAHLKAADPAGEAFAAIRDSADTFGIAKGKIGIEENFEGVAPPLNIGESSVPTAAAKEMLQKALPDAQLADATELINRLRLCKTESEIEKLRIANAIAGFGLAAFREHAAAGISEIELAALVDSAVAVRGSGYKGVKSARGFAQISSAQGTEKGWRPCEITTGRRLQNGDIVLLELGAVADGFWADNTRVSVIGGPDDKQQEIYNLILQAQQAAIDSIRPGTRMSQVDKAARDIITAAGYGDYFLHVTGHGIGWRYHEFPPLLHPEMDDVLKTGMVTSVEPGLYIPGFGGMRVEDIVAVGENGADVLSRYSKDLV
jgi:Xaa-Pro aminopeptidase